VERINFTLIKLDGKSPSEMLSASYSTIQDIFTTLGRTLYREEGSHHLADSAEMAAHVGTRSKLMNAYLVPVHST
jgi:hypothetical protein